MPNLCEKFKDFLATVDLAAYREKYRPVKLVEMDLPRDIQAISLLYKIYWDEKKFFDFEHFYEEYLRTYKVNIEAFRIKITMCKKCYYRGLPARIYRTWASIITQIHAGYIAEKVFGDDSVSMSADLDHKGADFQVKYHNKILNFQVKKQSQSRERRAEKAHGKKIKGQFVEIHYEVPSDEYFNNPRKKDGSYRLPYKRFVENKNLQRLPNGFVVFTSRIFEDKKRELDSL